MSDRFDIKIATWLADDLHCTEESGTMAVLEIAAGDKIITRVEDSRAKATRDTISVSAYPLALWLAANWWRLRWEGPAYAVAQTDWKLSHVMAASGSGYVWPPLTIQSDGDGVHFSMRGSSGRELGEADIRFIEPVKAYVSGSTFEYVISDFVERVLERLDAIQLPNTELARVWAEVQVERRDESLSWPRRLEAILGFDPETADQDTVLRLMHLASARGAGVAEELTAAEHENAPAMAEQIASLLGSSGGAWVPSKELLALDPVTLGEKRPYEIGYRKAMELRSRLKLGNGPLNQDVLGSIFGLSTGLLAADLAPSPVGVSERAEGLNHLLLRSRAVVHRRFEFARLAGDRLYVDNDDHWSLATRGHTARQQFQRAFAAEFLCPISGIKARTSPNSSGEEVEDIAEEFDVSTYVVQRQMVNDGMLNPAFIGQV